MFGEFMSLGGDRASMGLVGIAAGGVTFVFSTAIPAAMAAVGQISPDSVLPLCGIVAGIAVGVVTCWNTSIGAAWQKRVDRIQQQADADVAHAEKRLLDEQTDHDATRVALNKCRRERAEALYKLSLKQAGIEAKSDDDIPGTAPPLTPAPR